MKNSLFKIVDIVNNLSDEKIVYLLLNLFCLGFLLVIFKVSGN